ncbi:hypothetical protein pkur_cds_767 [Pandoravirus kuranda]|uniref:Uncharacterized protein n=2 Tax=Pandoravirus TaxID=2060084 RepID=A0AA95J821_9VIRU|nr:hypothetical protein pneo_cds_691 [Pandoravirus neocaledonia]AVK76298.1 hypothetical protein pneo_cds_691 [Pandoravirus neocaledonia]WBR14941.1 hypothetical protein pkur_cds_767 [Pandoravirus kuranda]
MDEFLAEQERFLPIKTFHTMRSTSFTEIMRAYPQSKGLCLSGKPENTTALREERFRLFGAQNLPHDAFDVLLPNEPPYDLQLTFLQEDVRCASDRRRRGINLDQDGFLANLVTEIKGAHASDRAVDHATATWSAGSLYHKNDGIWVFLAGDAEHKAHVVLHQASHNKLVLVRYFEQHRYGAYKTFIKKWESAFIRTHWKVMALEERRFYLKNFLLPVKA